LQQATEAVVLAQHGMVDANARLAVLRDAFEKVDAERRAFLESMKQAACLDDQADLTKLVVDGIARSVEP